MSDLTSGTTFAPGQLVTAEILNRLVSDATINEGSIKNTHIGAEMINNQPSLDQVTLSPDDYFLVYDSSEGDYKKVKKSDLAEVNNTQYTGGMITGDDGTETIIDSATGNIVLLGGSIEVKEGSITSPSLDLKSGNLSLDTGNVYINGTADGEGILDVKGTLFASKITGNIVLTGGITASSDLSAQNITASGSITSGTSLSAPSLTVTNNLSAGGIGSFGSVTTTGDISGVNSTLTGNLSIEGNITNTGNIISSGNITAPGQNVTAQNLTASGSITGLDITSSNEITAKDITATGDVSLRNSVFGESQIDFSKNLIMKTETTEGSGDGAKVYTDEVQVNKLNDRNSGSIKIDSVLDVSARIEARGGASVKNNFWTYLGEDPDDPDALTSAVLRHPEFKWTFLNDSVNVYRNIFENRGINTDNDPGSHKIIESYILGGPNDDPKWYINAEGTRENDFQLVVNGTLYVQRQGKTSDYWRISPDTDAPDQSNIWRKTETQDIVTTTGAEYTTGKVIQHFDYAWKDSDFLGADVLYNFGSSATPFHMICRGNFTCTGTKNFKIEHPVETGMDLRHCAIEGPKADLIYRGKAQLSHGLVAININTATNMCHDTFVNLVRDVQVFVQNNETWDQVRGSVEGNILTIKSQNTESNANIDWMVVAERNDTEYRKTLTEDKYETCVPRLEESDLSTPN